MSEQTQSPQPSMPELPPTPRDFSGPSMSELIPLTSKKINILKSGLLIPAAVTAAVCTLMWSVSNFMMTMDIIGGYLLFVMFYAVYIYSGVQTPLYIYVVPCVLVYFQLETSIFNLYAFVFRDILPGGDLPKDAGFIGTFVNMFFGAGLCEESLKATPAILGLWLARRAQAGSPVRVPGLTWFRVTSPIEGMMIGFAAGAMFIFLETLFEYVPRQVQQAGGGGVGIANGFWLLFPRTLQGITGHMGWAAISGYFIGMAARYPKATIKLVLIGLLVPAVLHGFWNSSSQLGTIGRWGSSALSLFFFIGCMLKARQLEAMQNGRAFVPSQSILAGTPVATVVPEPVVEKQATSWGGLAHVLAAFVPTSGPIPAVSMPTAVPVAPPATPLPAAAPTPAPAYVAPQPASPSSAAPATPQYTLEIGAARFGIVPGQTIDLSILFPNAQLPQGSLAEVIVNPKDPTIVGLKNMTGYDWVATTLGGTQVTVLKGRNLKLVDGERIVVGPAEITVQTI